MRDSVPTPGHQLLSQTTKCACKEERIWTHVKVSSRFATQLRSLTYNFLTGDSGGPLMSEGLAGVTERFTLIGLVSFGPRTCGVSNFPGVYTRISSYVSWIMDNMETWSRLGYYFKEWSWLTISDCSKTYLITTAELNGNYCIFCSIISLSEFCTNLF